MWALAHLSLSSIFALIGLILLSISLATNHWIEYEVNRTNLTNLTTENATIRYHLISINTSEIYFDRSYGVFKKCFYNEVPSILTQEFLEFGQTCFTIHERKPAPTNNEDIDSQLSRRIDFIQAFIGLFAIGMISTGICIFLNIVFCSLRCTGRKFAAPILAVAVLLLLGVLIFAAAAIMWHLVRDLEQNVIHVRPYYPSWHPILKENSMSVYGWSYSCFWVGVFMVILSCVMQFIGFAIASKEVKDVKRREAELAAMNYFDQMKFSYIYADYSYPRHPVAYGPHYVAEGNTYYIM